MLGKIVNKCIKRLSLNRGDLNRNDRIGALHRAWGHVFTNHLTGDYVEFGVYKGESLVVSFKQYSLFKGWLKGQLVSPEKWRREVAKNYADVPVAFHGLDTFGGMPDNDEGALTFAAGTFMSSIDQVLSTCSSQGLQPPILKLYKGLFSETKSELTKNLKKVAIVNIDSDLYASARDALEIVAPLLQTGIVLLFDDWNAYSADTKKGERLAFSEFQKKYPQYTFEPWFSYGYSGQTFLCVGSG